MKKASLKSALSLSRIRVLDVVDGSPAAEAGVQIGDRLTAVDGEAHGKLELERVRRRLRGSAGSEVELSFERGGEPIAVTLRLRRVI